MNCSFCADLVNNNLAPRKCPVCNNVIQSTALSQSEYLAKCKSGIKLICDDHKNNNIINWLFDSRCKMGLHIHNEIYKYPVTVYLVVCNGRYCSDYHTVNISLNPAESWGIDTSIFSHYRGNVHIVSCTRSNAIRCTCSAYERLSCRIYICMNKIAAINANKYYVAN